MFILFILFYIFSLIVSINSATQNSQGPQNHLENTQAFQVFSKSPLREMLLIIKGHWFSKTLENLRPAAHAAPRKSTTSYSGWVISKGSSTFTSTQEKWLGHQVWRSLTSLSEKQRFCSSVCNSFHWLHELNDTAQLPLCLGPNVSEWVMFSLKKHLQGVARRKFSRKFFDRCQLTGFK